MGKSSYSVILKPQIIPDIDADFTRSQPTNSVLGWLIKMM